MPTLLRLDIMIIYFTGTGNSRFIAEAIADKMEDSIVSMNDILKNDLPKKFESEKPYVIVSPIYAWRLPRFVDGFIRDSEFNGNRKMYIVATMGANTGKADKFAEQAVTSKGMEFMGFTGIAMTDNYINWSDVPDSDTIKATNTRALGDAEFVAELIRVGRMIGKSDKTSLAGIKSGFINNMFANHMSDPGFSVNDACTGCGKCAGFCPANNIELRDGKAVLLGHCYSCYGCIHRCPVKAINIKGKTEKRGRFVCPEYSEFRN